MSTDLQQQQQKNNEYNQDYERQNTASGQQQYGDQQNQQQQQFSGGNQYNQNNYNGDDDDDDDGDDGDDDNDNDQDQKPDLDDLNADGIPKCIRLRGLPWSATHQEILDFLKTVNVIDGSKGIHLVTSRWDGKNTGEAFVEVQSQMDVEEALKLNKGMMGHRYIEVFTANPKEAQAAMKKTGGPGQSFVVKLRGLPYACTEQQIEEFFNGLEIKPDREGILFVMDRRGRATGEAYVQFESQEDTEQALGRNREKIGHRYIEIFRSSLAELKRSANGNGRPGPYDLKDRGGNRGDFGGGRNMRGGNDWNSGSFGVGANNSLGFNNMNNSGNFGNNFGNSGNFGNNNGGGGGGGGFGGNNSGGFGNNRFNGPNNSGGGGGGGNFSGDFGDFGNFGNNRNNFNDGPNDFSDDNGFGGRGNNGGNFGTGGNFGNMGNFGNFGNNGGNMAGGGFNNMGGGGNFGPIGGGRNDCEFFSVHMRGLPYSSYENDVFKFFDPIRPANVRINFNKKGLHSGTADVFFDTYEDAQLAMKRHKDQMGNRYIELFFDGKIKMGNNNNNSNNNNNNVPNNFSRRI